MKIYKLSALAVLLVFAVAGYPNENVFQIARTMAVETVHCTVSETRSCAAHRFCHGLYHHGLYQWWNGYKAP